MNVSAATATASALVSGLLALTAAPALADVVVIGSDTANIAIGTILTSGQRIDVPQGASVRIMTQSGRIELIAGPAGREVSAYDDEGATDESLWTEVAALSQSAVEGLDETSGATRGLAPEEPEPAPYTFSWQAIPLDAEGDMCVARDAPLKLVRSATEGVLAVTIVDLQGGNRTGEAVFAAGKAEAPWPASIAPRVGAFALRPAGAAARQVRLRLISPVPAPADAVRVLHSQRCELQRNALLEALRDPKFQVSALSP